MRIIVRKIQQWEAIGKSTIFCVRGQPVDQLKIERWQKRCGEVKSKDYSASSRVSSRMCKVPKRVAKAEVAMATLSAPSTPSDISYDTAQEARSPPTRSSSPDRRNTSIFGSIDFELEKSLLVSRAIVAPDFSPNRLVNAFDVSGISKHEFVEGQYSAPRTGIPFPPPSFAFKPDTPGSNRCERVLTGRDPASSPPSHEYEEPVQR